MLYAYLHLYIYIYLPVYHNIINNLFSTLRRVNFPSSRCKTTPRPCCKFINKSWRSFVRGVFITAVVIRPKKSYGSRVILFFTIRILWANQYSYWNIATIFYIYIISFLGSKSTIKPAFGGKLLLTDDSVVCRYCVYLNIYIAK